MLTREDFPDEVASYKDLIRSLKINGISEILDLLNNENVSEIEKLAYSALIFSIFDKLCKKFYRHLCSFKTKLDNNKDGNHQISSINAFEQLEVLIAIHYNLVDLYPDSYESPYPILNLDSNIVTMLIKDFDDLELEHKQMFLDFVYGDPNVLIHFVNHCNDLQNNNTEYELSCNNLEELIKSFDFKSASKSTKLN